MSRIGSQPSAEGEMLDVAGDIKCKALAAGPAVILPLIDVGMVITAVTWKFEHGGLRLPAPK
jgi:hypothetical protein